MKKCPHCDAENSGAFLHYEKCNRPMYTPAKEIPYELKPTKPETWRPEKVKLHHGPTSANPLLKSYEIGMRPCLGVSGCFRLSNVGWITSTVFWSVM